MLIVIFCRYSAFHSLYISIYIFYMYFFFYFFFFIVCLCFFFFFFFFSSRRRHTRLTCDWSSDVCSSDLGMYEYKMDMDMGQIPGMPPGMGKQSHTFQHCVTAEDINRGEVGKGGRDNTPKNCEVKDFRMSGNTASYRMVCTGERPMEAENRVTFEGNGYTMDMKMAMNQRGQPMHMTQHMQARYLGACTK